MQLGDTLMVTRIDRLARSINDLQDIVYLLKGRGIVLKATEQPVNTDNAAGKAFLDMLGVFAEFETNLRRERQIEGISAAKTRDVYRGRKRSIDRAEVQRLRSAEKLGVGKIARRLGIGRASVYRIFASEDRAVSGYSSGFETTSAPGSERHEKTGRLFRIQGELRLNQGKD